MRAKATIPFAAILCHQNKPYTTSIKVAEAFGRFHKSILGQIYTIECTAEFKKRNFKDVTQAGQGGTNQTFYEITQDGFLLLTLAFRGKRAAKIRRAYINAFNQAIKNVESQPLTIEQNRHLHTTIKSLAQTHQKPRNYYYHQINQTFHLKNFSEITAKLYPLICAHLNTTPIDTDQIPEPPQYKRYFYPKHTAKPRINIYPNQSCLTAKTLLENDYPKPIFKLLTELEQDGHEVEGCWLEWKATRYALECLFYGMTTVQKTSEEHLRRGRQVVWP